MTARDRNETWKLDFIKRKIPFEINKPFLPMRKAQCVCVCFLCTAIRQYLLHTICHLLSDYAQNTSEAAAAAVASRKRLAAFHIKIVNIVLMMITVFVRVHVYFLWYVGLLRSYTLVSRPFRHRTHKRTFSFRSCQLITKKFACNMWVVHVGMCSWFSLYPTLSLLFAHSLKKSGEKSTNVGRSRAAPKRGR